MLLKLLRLIQGITENMLITEIAIQIIKQTIADLATFIASLKAGIFSSKVAETIIAPDPKVVMCLKASYFNFKKSTIS